MIHCIAYQCWHVYCWPLLSTNHDWKVWKDATISPLYQSFQAANSSFYCQWFLQYLCLIRDLRPIIIFGWAEYISLFRQADIWNMRLRVSNEVNCTLQLRQQTWSYAWLSQVDEFKLMLYGMHICGYLQISGPMWHTISLHNDLKLHWCGSHITAEDLETQLAELSSLQLDWAERSTAAESNHAITSHPVSPSWAQHL